MNARNGTDAVGNEKYESDDGWIPVPVQGVGFAEVFAHVDAGIFMCAKCGTLSSRQQFKAIDFASDGEYKTGMDLHRKTCIL